MYTRDMTTTMQTVPAEPSEEEISQAKAQAIALTAGIKLARMLRLDDVRDETGQRPQVTTFNVYAVAELYGYDIGEAVVVTPKATANYKPRSKPVGKPAANAINDNGTVTCPCCNQALPTTKYPTIKDGTRDFRECRTCIKTRRQAIHI